MFLVISKTLAPFLAVLVGVFRFHHMDRSTRLVFFQIFAYTTILALTKQVMAFQKMNDLELNTNRFYNVYLPVETLLLIGAAFYHFENRFFRMFIRISLVLFGISFCTELFYNGISKYCSFSDTFANITLTLIFGVILYHEFKSVDFTWKRAIFAWLALGVFVFSASTATYMSIMDYLNNLDPEMNRKVFRLLFGVAGNLKYILIVLGFWFIRPDSTRSV